MRLFGFQQGPADSGQAWVVSPIGGQPTTGDQITGTIVITVLATLIIWVLAFILMCSMIFRSLALIVLAAVAPVALMLMPWEKTKSWTGRWCEVVIALLLAKPLAATVLAVAVKLYADATSFAAMAAGAVGMTLACAAPLMALKLVGFAGGELAAAAQTAGGGHLAHTGAHFAGRQLGQQLRSHHLLAPGGSMKSPKVVQSSAKPETAHVKDSADSGATSSSEKPKIQQRPGAATSPQAPTAPAPDSGQAAAPQTPNRQQKSGQPRAFQSPPGGDPAPSGKDTPVPPQQASPGVSRPSAASASSESAPPKVSSAPKPGPPASRSGNPPIRPPHVGGRND